VLATYREDEDIVTDVELAAFELEVVLATNGGAGTEEEVIVSVGADGLASAVVLKVVP